jgi:hypothetical protein
MSLIGHPGAHQHCFHQLLLLLVVFTKFSSNKFRFSYAVLYTVDPCRSHCCMPHALFSQQPHLTADRGLLATLCLLFESRWGF